MPRETDKTRTIKAITNKFPAISAKQAERLYDASKAGGEISKYGSPEIWLEERFFPNVVMLNRDDYVNALTQSLRIAPRLAGTDFGMTRQRDLGQVWTDTARGFLGEIAFVRLLKQRFGITLDLDYSLGLVADYLNSDIKKAITLADGSIAELQSNISIKTTKFQGIWLDIPGAQIGHSDAFFLIKLGIEREHFVSFLKDISFVKDKLLPQAKKIGAISEQDADDLWNSLPVFENIPCYVCGYIDTNSVDNHKKISSVHRELKKRDGTSKDKYEVSEYIGWIYKGVPDNLDLAIQSKSEFISIGTFTPSNNHFISSIGHLKNSDADWEQFLTKATEVPIKIESQAEPENEAFSLT
jgi:hypothetical protein